MKFTDREVCCKSCLCIYGERLNQEVEAADYLHFIEWMLKYSYVTRAAITSLTRKLNISPAMPFFTVESCKVYALYDPHLLKNICNNLKKYGFEIIEEDVVHEALWEHIVEFFTFDSSLSIRMAPKLTQRHTDLPPFSPMRVNLATQTLSHSVAAGMLTLTKLGHLDESATETAEFVEKMDKLFNTFNSKSGSEKQTLSSAITPTSNHIQFLEEMLDWFPYVKPNKKMLPKNHQDWHVYLDG